MRAAGAFRHTTTWATLCLASAIACGESRAPTSPARERPETAVTMAGPTATPADEVPSEARIDANAKCESCHQEIAGEWRQSRHREAASNARFLRGLSREPSEWCVGCHAPSFDTEAPSRAAVAMGVSCIDCHQGMETRVPKAQVASHRTPAVPGPAARARGSATCGGCHEFPLPTEPSIAMQWTVSEHQRSPFAQTACRECHMPAAQGHRDHRFGVSDAMILASANIEVSRTATGIAFAFRQGRVGHAFPTGDTFRRIRVEAETLDARSHVTEQKTRLLSRRMPKAGAGGRPRMEDDRLFLEGPVERIELSFTHPERALRYRIAYERAESELILGRMQPEAVELAHGALPQIRKP